MTPKTDSVAVLREFRAHASGNYRCSSTDACRSYYQQQIDALDAAIAALSPPGGVGDAVTELRKVAKRNLRSLIERSADPEKALMLKCLEELS